MNYITTTELRTKSGELIKALLLGNEVEILHRSKKLGRVKLVKEENLKVMNSKKLYEAVQDLDHPPLTMKEIDRRYRMAMMKKHGQGFR